MAYTLVNVYDGTRVALDPTQRHVMGRQSVQDDSVPGKLALGIPSSEAGISRFQAMIRSDVGPTSRCTIRTSNKAKNPTRIVRDYGRTVIYLRQGEQSTLAAGDRIELDSYNLKSNYVYRLENDAQQALEKHFSGDDEVYANEEDLDMDGSSGQRRGSSGFGNFFGAGALISAPAPESALEQMAASAADEEPAAPPTVEKVPVKSKNGRVDRRGTVVQVREISTPQSAEDTAQKQAETAALSEFLKQAGLAAYLFKLMENEVDTVEKLCAPGLLGNDDLLLSYGLKKAHIVKLRRAAREREGGASM
uniref:SAM domain-containing protein n=1 Tax=Rhizochromulina marina TaxID=1034831 RepID=A0A7S2S2Y1_9STRA